MTKKTVKEDLSNILEEAMKLNIETIVLDFSQITLTLPSDLATSLIAEGNETALQCVAFEQSLLDDSQIKYIEANQPINMAIAGKDISLTKASKMPKDEESMKNIAEYYPMGPSVIADKSFYDIVMEFKYTGKDD